MNRKELEELTCFQIFTCLMFAFMFLYIGVLIPNWERAHRDLDRRLHKIESPETDPVHRAMHKITYDECRGR